MLHLVNGFLRKGMFLEESKKCKVLLHYFDLGVLIQVFEGERTFTVKYDMMGYRIAIFTDY